MSFKGNENKYCNFLLTSVSHREDFRFFPVSVFLSLVKILASLESRSPSASTDPSGSVEEVFLLPDVDELGPKNASSVFSTGSSSELE